MAPTLPGETGPQIYCIRLRGHLGRRLFDAFAPLCVSVSGGTTTLHGPIDDQAALHGILARIESLGLELMELRRLPDPRPPPRPLRGDGSEQNG